jgi:hypothetical protein
MKSEVKGTVRYEEGGQGYREIWRARSRVPWDMKSKVKGTVRYEEQGQGYRGVEKVGKHSTRFTGGILPFSAAGGLLRHKQK